jgi:hypothetical protein
MMTESRGCQLSLREAVEVFQGMPAEWQLASLHPEMVELDAKRDVLLQPVYWCFRADDQCLIHSFQLGDNPGLAIKDIQSAYGYGGPLSNTDNPQFLKIADGALSQWAQSNSVVAEFLRFHPLIPHGKWYSGVIANNRETVYIDLAKDLFEQYQARRRTDVRRFLESGLRVERVPPQTMQRIFPELYSGNMDQVGAASDYYFPESYFDALFHFGGAENWLVYSDNQVMAGAVILVSAQAKVAEYYLGAKAQGSERHRATIGLLHVAANFYKSMCYRYFYLGGGRSVAANDSLLFFKKGFSSLTGYYQTGSKVYEPQHYTKLKSMFPNKAATGRVLFYKD